MANRLASERSPYLLQHQENPVDWYPWGEEAFARARAEDKPVFVSIGYAACHWCHVMAHESFEDPDTAAIMNERFINIKVDREERPEVDAVYMNAVHAMGEGGGWPLSAFCDADGKPFFIGTYFPPENRYGRPGFRHVLETMARVYRQDRDRVSKNGEAVLESLRQMDAHFRHGAEEADVGALSPSLLIAGGRKLVQQSDGVRGGFGGRPKFPSSSAHDLLARAGRLSFGEPAREAFLRQVDAMARGGIYDHLGGGFARYSVDEKWLVPHFEKMLYDNAQLLSIYADAFAMTADASRATRQRYARVIEETVAWLGREMKDPAGGLYASLDADSEGEEGKFYVWTPAEVKDVLGPADAIVFCRTYGVTEAGNFEGKNVLSRVVPEADGADEEAIAEMRRRLLAAREARVRPETDTKVLAGWNGLALSGLVRAWEATGYEPALALAEEVAGFLAREMVREGGARIWRVWKDGSAALEGTLDDYAFCARGLMALASATDNAELWSLARGLVAAMVDKFYEQVDGVDVFFMTEKAAGDGLIHRPESASDGAIPAGSAVAVECLLWAALVGGDDEALGIAERYLAGRAPQAAEQPFMSARILAALDLYLNGQVVVVSDGEGRDALLTAARRAFAPARIVAGSWAAAEILADKKPASDGRAQLYVCRGQTCSAPITDPAEVAGALSP